MGIILVDLSYYVIHRYYAATRFFKFQEREDEPTQQEMFDRFDKSFSNDVKSLIKRHDTEEIIFAKDTPRETIWRMDIFPEYKGGRAALNKFDPEIFKHTIEDLIPRLGYKIIECPRAEADDIIAVACQVLEDEKIVVITNDHDYIQLLGKNNTKIQLLNASNEPLTKKYTPEMLEVFLEFKIIKGDKSDNIPSIGKLIGEKTALKLARDPAALASKLASNDAIAKQYELNKQLMSFECIPEDIVEGIKRALEKN